jgi:hypothetical protein
MYPLSALNDILCYNKQEMQNNATLNTNLQHVSTL